VQDWKPIKSGGETPEHRILYFRRERVDDSGAVSFGEIIWDRAGRVDKVFGSGFGDKVDASEETRAIAYNAMQNTRRLAEERAERRAAKAKDRDRRAKSRRRKELQQQQHSTEFESNQGKSADDGTKRMERFVWRSSSWFTFDESDDSWREKSNNPFAASSENIHTKPKSLPDLKILTWNVLFDVFDQSEAKKETLSRWQRLVSAIANSNADIITLQEVTPDFVAVICSNSFVRASFCVSASPADASSVTPHGNLILWRSVLLSPISSEGIHVCFDGARARAIVAILKTIGEGGQHTTMAVANIHLYADRKVDSAIPAEQQQTSRADARRRELTSIVGQLGKLEDRHKKDCPNCRIQTVICGDFNSEDEELADGCFSGASAKGMGCFHDAWLMGSPDGSGGHTWDPSANSRAAHSNSEVRSKNIQRRRIDRIYLKDGNFPVQCVAEIVTGIDPASEANSLPPSDHFGLAVTLSPTPRPAGVEHQEYFAHDAWAATAMPCKDSILALMLRPPDSVLADLRSTFAKDSSLVEPHVTLLYGFVELHNSSLSLAMSTVAEAIKSSKADASEHLHFSRDSLDVLSHRGSATVYAAPTLQEKSWLYRLYHDLRRRFKQCEEQEQHNEEKVWVPHLGLGTFGSSSNARSAIREWVSDHGPWNDISVEVNGLTILQRGEVDGKFHPVATVSLGGETRIDDTILGAAHSLESVRPFDKFPTSSIVADAGLNASKSFQKTAKPILSLLSTACEIAAERLGFSSTLNVVGSSRFQAALPFMSDVDTVAILRQKDRSVNRTLDERSSVKSFFSSVSNFIHQHTRQRFPVDIRMRSADSGHLNLLTFKLMPKTPSIDLLVAFVDSSDVPVSASSASALSNKTNADATIEIVELSALDALSVKGSDEHLIRENARAIFSGALRCIKLWAKNNDVYGQAAGFLPGAAYATMLAVFLSEGFSLREIEIDAEELSPELLASRALEVVDYFFKRAATWSWPEAISITSPSKPIVCSESGPNEASILATKRGTMAITANTIGTHDVEANYARSVTASTTQATLDEFKRAQSLLQLRQTTSSTGKSSYEKLLEKRSVEEFIEMHEFLVCFEVFVEDQDTDISAPANPSMITPAEIKAWGSSRALSTLVYLEQHLKSRSMLRLRPKTIKPNGEDRFFWLLGVNGGGITEFKTLIANCSSNYPEDHQSSLMLNVSIVEQDDALHQFASKLRPGPLLPLKDNIAGLIERAQDGEMKIKWMDQNSKARVDNARIVIMRGIPGSGKSETAKFLARRNSATGTVISADLYFDKHHGGHFQPSSLGAAHASCREEFSLALQRFSEDIDGASGKGQIIVDNTNSQYWEYQWYLEQAQMSARLRKDDVVVLELYAANADEAKRCHLRSIHNPTKATVSRMLERWETDSRAILLRPFR